MQGEEAISTWKVTDFGGREVTLCDHRELHLHRCRFSPIMTLEGFFRKAFS